MANASSPFAELKRRKVYRAAVAYAVAAFLVLQVADLVLPGLPLPDWAYRVVVWAVLLGFPVCLVLAWAFEIRDGRILAERSPGGELAEESVERGGGWVAAALTLGSALAVAALGWFALRPAIAALRTSENPVALAVLPVQPLTESSEDIAFAAGLHDELLNQLAKLGAFRLKSRTSVLAYADRTKTVPEIAAELGVEAILEAGVRSAGESFRLTFSLIDGPSDEVLWSDDVDWTYSAEDIVSVQIEVARGVATTLRAELTDMETSRLADASTDNPRAYELYLAGLGFFANRTNRAQNRLAIERFEEAIELDPEFAAAHAYLAQAWVFHAWFFTPLASFGIQVEPWRDWEPLGAVATATEHAERAAVLAPNAFETHLARAELAYRGHRRYDEALEHLTAAEALRPGDLSVLETASYIRLRQGRWDEPIAGLERVVADNPRNAQVLAQLGLINMMLGRYEHALGAFERALTHDPANFIGHRFRFRTVLWGLEDPDSAEALIPDAERHRGERLAAGMRADVAMARGDLGTASAHAVRSGDRQLAATLLWAAGEGDRASAYADSVLAEQEPWAEKETERHRPQTIGLPSRRTARMYALKGDRERALDWANRAVALVTAPPPLPEPEIASARGARAEVLAVFGDTAALSDIEYVVATPDLGRFPAEFRLHPLFRELHPYPRFWQILGCPDRDC